MSNTVNHHANSFDFLRLVAAWAVLYSHSFVLYGLPLPTPLPGQSYGSLAVAVFFAISGYLIAQSWLGDPDARRFFIKRSLRIFPGLWCAVAFCTLVIGPMVTTLPLTDYFLHPSTWRYFANNACLISSQFDLPGVFETNPFARAVNASLWTLKYEAIMYGLIALSGLLLPKNQFKWGCLGFILFFAIIWNINPIISIFPSYLNNSTLKNANWLDVINYKELANLGIFFFAGAAFHAFKWRSSYTLSAAFIATLFISIDYQKNEMIVFFLWISLPIITLNFAKNFKITIPNDISYGVYIYAFPIQQFITWWVAGKNISWAMTLIISTIITFILSIISWKMIEKPFIAQKKKFFI